jgi:hypothetical protein
MVAMVIYFKNNFVGIFFMVFMVGMLEGDEKLII